MSLRTTGCENCRQLQQKLELAQKEYVLNFGILKKKIISTDMLVKKYISKQQECEAQSLKMEQMTKLMNQLHSDITKRDAELAKALQEVEPLRAMKENYETTQKSQTNQIQSLEDKLLGAEQLQRQLQLALREKEDSEQKQCAANKQHEKEITKLKSAEDELKKLHSELEAMTESKKIAESRVSASLKLAVYFGRCLEKRGIIPCKASSKVSQYLRTCSWVTKKGADSGSCFTGDIDAQLVKSLSLFGVNVDTVSFDRNGDDILESRITENNDDGSTKTDSNPGEQPLTHSPVMGTPTFQQAIGLERTPKKIKTNTSSKTDSGSKNEGGFHGRTSASDKEELNDPIEIEDNAQNEPKSKETFKDKLKETPVLQNEATEEMEDSSFSQEEASDECFTDDDLAGHQLEQLLLNESGKLGGPKGAKNKNSRSRKPVKQLFQSKENISYKTSKPVRHKLSPKQEDFKADGNVQTKSIAEVKISPQRKFPMTSTQTLNVTTKAKEEGIFQLPLAIHAPVAAKTPKRLKVLSNKDEDFHRQKHHVGFELLETIFHETRSRHLLSPLPPSPGPFEETSDSEHEMQDGCFSPTLLPQDLNSFTGDKGIEPKSASNDKGIKEDDNPYEEMTNLIVNEKLDDAVTANVLKVTAIEPSTAEKPDKEVGQQVQRETLTLEHANDLVSDDIACSDDGIVSELPVNETVELVSCLLPKILPQPSLPSPKHAIDTSVIINDMGYGVATSSNKSCNEHALNNVMEYSSFISSSSDHEYSATPSSTPDHISSIVYEEFADDEVVRSVVKELVTSVELKADCARVQNRFAAFSRDVPSDGVETPGSNTPVQSECDEVAEQLLFSPRNVKTSIVSYIGGRVRESSTITNGVKNSERVECGSPAELIEMRAEARQSDSESVSSLFLPSSPVKSAVLKIKGNSVVVNGFKATALLSSDSSPSPSIIDEQQLDPIVDSSLELLSSKSKCNTAGNMTSDSEFESLHLGECEDLTAEPVTNGTHISRKSGAYEENVLCDNELINEQKCKRSSYAATTLLTGKFGQNCRVKDAELTSLRQSPIACNRSAALQRKYLKIKQQYANNFVSKGIVTSFAMDSVSHTKGKMLCDDVDMSDLSNRTHKRNTRSFMDGSECFSSKRPPHVQTKFNKYKSVAVINSSSSEDECCNDTDKSVHYDKKTDLNKKADLDNNAYKNRVTECKPCDGVYCSNSEDELNSDVGIDDHGVVQEEVFDKIKENGWSRSGLRRRSARLNKFSTRNRNSVDVTGIVDATKIKKDVAPIFGTQESVQKRRMNKSISNGIARILPAKTVQEENGLITEKRRLKKEPVNGKADADSGFNSDYIKENGYSDATIASTELAVSGSNCQDYIPVLRKTEVNNTRPCEDERKTDTDVESQSDTLDFMEDSDTDLDSLGSSINGIEKDNEQSVTENVESRKMKTNCLPNTLSNLDLSISTTASSDIIDCKLSEKTFKNTHSEGRFCTDERVPNLKKAHINGKVGEQKILDITSTAIKTQYRFVENMAPDLKLMIDSEEKKGDKDSEGDAQESGNKTRPNYEEERTVNVFRHRNCKQSNSIHGEESNVDRDFRSFGSTRQPNCDLETEIDTDVESQVDVKPAETILEKEDTDTESDNLGTLEIQETDFDSEIDSFQIEKAACVKSRDNTMKATEESSHVAITYSCVKRKKVDFSCSVETDSATDAEVGSPNKLQTRKEGSIKSVYASDKHVDEHVLEGKEPCMVNDESDRDKLLTKSNAIEVVKLFESTTKTNTGLDTNAVETIVVKQSIICSDQAVETGSQQVESAKNLNVSADEHSKQLVMMLSPINQSRESASKLVKVVRTPAKTKLKTIVVSHLNSPKQLSQNSKFEVAELMKETFATPESCCKKTYRYGNITPIAPVESPISPLKSTPDNLPKPTTHEKSNASATPHVKLLGVKSLESDKKLCKAKTNLFIQSVAANKKKKKIASSLGINNRPNFATSLKEDNLNSVKKPFLSKVTGPNGIRLLKNKTLANGIESKCVPCNEPLIDSENMCVISEDMNSSKPGLLVEIKNNSTAENGKIMSDPPASEKTASAECYSHWPKTKIRMALKRPANSNNGLVGKKLCKTGGSPPPVENISEGTESRSLDKPATDGYISSKQTDNRINLTEDSGTQTTLCKRRSNRNKKVTSVIPSDQQKPDIDTRSSQRIKWRKLSLGESVPSKYTEELTASTVETAGMCSTVNQLSKVSTNDSKCPLNTLHRLSHSGKLSAEKDSEMNIPSSAEVQPTELLELTGSSKSCTVDVIQKPTHECRAGSHAKNKKRLTSALHCGLKSGTVTSPVPADASPNRDLSLQCESRTLLSKSDRAEQMAASTCKSGASIKDFHFCKRVSTRDPSLPPAYIEFVTQYVDKFRRCVQKLLCPATNCPLISQPAGLTKAGTKFLHSIQSMADSQEQAAVINFFQQSVLFTIFNDKDITVDGAALLVRVYTALCKWLKDVEKPRILCYDLLSCGKPYAPFVIANIVDMWSEVLMYDGSSPLHDVMQFVLLGKVPKFSIDNNLSNFLQTTCRMKSCFQTSKDLVSTLLINLKVAALASDDAQQNEILQSLVLICKISGWQWTNDAVIVKLIWPVLQEWSFHQSRKDETKPVVNDRVIACYLRLMGYLGRSCPIKQNAPILKVMSCMEMLLSENFCDKISICVAEAAAESLAILKPYAPTLCESVLSTWTANSDCIISARVRTIINAAQTKWE